MPSQSYPLDPAISGGTIWGGQIAADNVSAHTTNQPSTNIHVSVDAKFFFRDNAFMRFSLGHGSLPTIPAKAQITSAKLRVLPTSTNSEALKVSAVVLVRDGKWNTPLDAPFAWRTTPLIDLQVTVKNPGGGTTLVPQTVSSAPDVFNIRRGGSYLIVGDPRDRGGQCVTIVTGGTLGQVLVQLSKTASQLGSVLCEVYAAVADDGSDDRPNGAPLATSDVILFNSLPTQPSSAEMLLTFSGGNQITLTAGKRYVFVFRETTTQGGALMNIHYDITGGYAGGQAVMGLVPFAFTDSNYPCRPELPHLYQADGSTIDVAPFGSVLTVDLPSFTSGVWLDVADMTQIVQEWIDAGGYVADVIALHLAVRSDSDPAGGSRFWNDATLDITWEIPTASAVVAWAGSGTGEAVGAGEDHVSVAPVRVAPFVPLGREVATMAIARSRPSRPLGRELTTLAPDHSES